MTNFRFFQTEKSLQMKISNWIKMAKSSRNEQFLLFPRCFQKVVLKTPKNQGLFGKGLSSINKNLACQHLIMGIIIIFLLPKKILMHLYLNLQRKKQNLQTFKGLLLISLPNNKILYWFKLKAFADDKINVI